MVILQDVSYIHPDKDLLFSDLNLAINRQDKIALTGNNGAGKSTLLKILAGNLSPSAGAVRATSKPYYVPQHFGQFNDQTIAEALQAGDKINALNEILAGNVTEANLILLDEDWTIVERCKEAFSAWGLKGLNPDQKMATLSGGQKTKVFLAGIIVNRPEIVLLDEPSNHLDSFSRNLLYDYIKSTTNAVVVVSHDRTLLNLIDTVHELGSRGITVYGGNYDFYAAQKKIEAEALDQDLKSREKLLRKAKETERESLQRQQKLDARGKKKQEKAGLPTISMNTFRNNAEKSTSRIKGVHAEKVETIAGELNKLRSSLPDMDKMKIDLDNSALHKGKVLITARDVNFGYDDHLLWKEGLSFQVRHGERIAIKGLNGSGKTTLIKMILGELQPRSGIIDSIIAIKTIDSGAIKTIDNVSVKTIYIDQDYSLIDDRLTVVEQVERFNSGSLQEHEIKIRLNRFLFTKDWWDKPCRTLSGGEKMRLILCSLTISDQAPDMIILDEPTNNLDIQNIEILTTAIRDYAGTLLVISHDEYFEKQIKVERSISLV